MAKNERQKRSARKARQAERAEKEAAVVENAVARGEDPEEAKAALDKSQQKKSEPKKVTLLGTIRDWFAGVMTEMRRVVWPTPKELRNFSFAVIGLLVVFGTLVWLVDTGVVAGLVQYDKLRPASEAETELVENAGDAEAEDAEAEATDGAEASENEAADAEATDEDAEAEDADAADESAEDDAESDSEGE